MNTAPDEWKRVLREAKALGMHADLRPANQIMAERFALYMSHEPTIHVSHDGTWTSDDGSQGANADECRLHLRLDHYRRMLDHRRARDMRGMLRDILIDTGQPASVITAITRNGPDAWHVTYRNASGPAHDTTIDHPDRRLDQAVAHEHDRIRAIAGLPTIDHDTRHQTLAALEQAGTTTRKQTT